jgi:hypothetical protein
MAEAFAKKAEIRGGRSESQSDIRRLNEAFAGRDKLKDFARGTLGLRENEFSVDQLNDSDFEQLKGAVLGELAKARANKYAWTNKPESVSAWLRDKFMTFFMFLSASFHSETMFHKNAETSSRVRDLLGRGIFICGFGGADPSEVAGSEEGFEIIGGATSSSVESSGVESDAPAAEILPERADPREGRAGSVESRTILLGADLVVGLSVIDTPRDGSCMLWALEASWDKGTSFGDDNNARIKTRDVTIPGYRQAISIGLRTEAENLRTEARIRDLAAANKLEEKANALEFRAQDVELSGGMNPIAWSGSIQIEPSDMRFIAPTIGKDIAIISARGESSTCYLCTKEGKCISVQSLGGMNADDFSARLQSALRDGPAIFAEDGHARGLQYTPSSPD